MAEAHQMGAAAAVAASIALLLSAAWSLVDGRRTAGRRDHRFAVDRLVLVVVALVGLNDVLGAALFAAGPGPRDPLHLLYGAAALVTAPAAWAFGGRVSRDGVPAPRSRRDAWLVAAGVVLLGVELRLFMTG